MDVIQRPMDYTRIKANLKDGQYGDDHLAFATDVRLVFQNALKYNYDRENQCHIAACNALTASTPNDPLGVVRFAETPSASPSTPKTSAAALSPTVPRW